MASNYYVKDGLLWNVDGAGNIGSALDHRPANIYASVSMNAPSMVASSSLTIAALSGVLKAAAGLVSGSATTTDLPEGTNLYFTNARVQTVGDVRYLRLNGANSPSANINWGGFQINNMADPTSPQDAATKAYVDSASDSALANDNIWIGNASNIATPRVVSGDATLSNTGVLTISAGAIDNSKVSATAAIAYSKLALSNSIVNADINSAAAIAYSKLALTNSIVNADINAAAAIAYSKLALSNSIVNADINSAAAIAYTKLALTNSIVNADINSAAAIVYSKLSLASSLQYSDLNADLQNNHFLRLDGSNSPSADIDWGGFAIVDLAYLRSKTASPANSGFIMLANSDSINWRDSADSADYALAVGSADGLLSYGGIDLVDVSTAQSLSNKTINRAVNTLTNLQITNSDVNAAAAIVYSKLSLASSLQYSDLNADLQSNHFLRLDGSNSPSSNINWGGFKITNLANPTSPQDAVTKIYADNLAQGLSWKQVVRVASIADLNLASMPASIQGVTLVSGDRFLAKDQAAPGENGIYVFNGAAAAATRSLDADTAMELTWATVEIGADDPTMAGAIYRESDDISTLGTDPVAFVQVSQGMSLEFSSGVQKVGNLVTANVDNSTIEVNGSNQLRVKPLGITNNEVSASAAIAYSKLALTNSIVNADVNSAAAIAYSKLNLSASIVNADVAAGAAIAYSKLALTNSIVNADINAAAAIAYSKLNLALSIVNADIATGAAIAYSKLALTNSIVNADINSAAAIAYTKLALTNSIVNADINAAAAIAYSKLNLSASIVNADINAAAAIAYSKLNLSASIVNADVAAGAAIAYNKLAALTANRALQSDGSGFVSASAVTNVELGYLSGSTSSIQAQLDNRLKLDGTNSPTNDINWGGFAIFNISALADSTATDAVDIENRILKDTGGIPSLQFSDRQLLDNTNALVAQWSTDFVLSKNLLFASDGANDIGASGANRANNLWLAGNVNASQGNFSATASFGPNGHAILDSGSVTTTNATPAAVYTLALDTDAAYIVHVLLVGRRTDSADRVMIQKVVGAYNEGGSCALASPPGQDSTLFEGGQMSWDASFSVSGTNLVLNVTGGAGATIHWEAFISYVEAQ